MTFDLFFYTLKNGPKPTGEKIAESLSIDPNFSAQETKDGYEFLYNNKSTGVYFQMFYGPENPEDSGKFSFSGLQPTGLSAHVNFARPTFFAQESFPVIVEVANKFGFLVLDSQITSTHTDPYRPTAENLLESWAASNRWAVNVYRVKEKAILKYVPREKLDYVWRFERSTAELQSKVGPSIFVPTRIFLFENKNGAIVTCCTWVDYMAQAFPIVEMVLIGRTRRFGGFEQKGLANLADIRQVLAEVLSERSDPVPHLIVNQAELASDLRKRLDKLPLANDKDFQGVPFDQVVDIPP